MNRKITVTLFIVCIVSIAVFISCKYYVKIKIKEKYRYLPPFGYVTIQNQIQNTCNLPHYDGFVIQLFDTECEACQKEADDYFKNNESLQKILFLMLSTDSIQKIKAFALRKQLYNIDNFIFGQVNATEFEICFGPVKIPSLFFYNANKNFICKMPVANSVSVLNCFQNLQ